MRKKCLLNRKKIIVKINIIVMPSKNGHFTKNAKFIM